MAAVLVQSASNTGSGTSLTVTLSSAVTAGNCLVVIVETASTGTAPTVSNIKIGGNADNFAKAAGVLKSTVDCEIWTDQDIGTSSTSVVITFSASASGCAAWVEEWSGIATSSAVDKTNTGNGASTSTWSSGSTGTLTSANEVVIGADGTLAGTSTTVSTPGSPWTEQTQLSETIVSFKAILATGYQIVSSTSALTYNGTTSASVTDYAAVIITLLEASGTNVNLGTATVQVAAQSLGIGSTIPLSSAIIQVAAQVITPTVITGAVINPAIIKISANSLGVLTGTTLGTAAIHIAAQALTPTITHKILVASITNSSGTDQYGNAYLAGATTYTEASPTAWFATSLNGGFITAWFATSKAGPWNLTGQINFSSNGALNIDFPFISTQATSFNLVSGAAPIPASSAGITTVAQLVAVLQSVGILS